MSFAKHNVIRLTDKTVYPVKFANEGPSLHATTTISFDESKLETQF